MDQNYNSSQNDFLWTLLANPADDAYRYNYNLQRLVNDFPQSGILQALLAHTSEEKNLRQASAYFNARSLYKLINSPSSLIGVSDEKIIFQNGSRINGYSSHIPQDTPVPAAENYFSYNEPAVADTVAEEPLAATEGTEYQYQTPEHIHEPAETNLADSHTEHTIAEEPVIHTPEYEEIGDIQVAGHDANAIEETLQHGIPGHEALPAQPDALPETHETLVDEIKHEIENEVPVAEPIINYAFGLGRRMPSDEEYSEAVPAQEEVHAEETGTGEHGTAPDILYEHSVEENVAEHHLPPPVPEETLAEVHPGDADLPPTVYEPIAEHSPPPVPAEALVENHPADAEFPPAVPAEHQYVHEHEPAEEQPIAEHSFGGTHENNEPVQQYRPWNEPEAETQEPQISKEQVNEYQPAEEYKPWEEPATANHHPQVTEEHTGHQPAEEHKPWETTPTEHVEADTNAGGHNIEDETFDEITDIQDVSIEHDILSNAVAADYFGFDRTFGEHKEPVPEKPTDTPATEPVNERIGDAEQQDLSKYHDEKMPYSFLWWLDKTRKEHSGVYQPYVPPVKESAPDISGKAKAGADELQQQYYENIFHITSVEELDKSVPPPPFAANPSFSEKKKEQLIIDRFIEEEPQIRPQSSDKLDNENKAKKSSEDRDELVSETLAAIYSDQMLYHKAIASYKKLMLKFPEKSRYFGAKIEALEKKTN